MRSDIFSNRKCVHIKIDKDVHTELRKKLFLYGLTMQDIFHDYAELIIQESPRVEKILKRVSTTKLRHTIENLSKPKEKRETHMLGELDANTLYSLLEANGQEDEE